MESCTCAFLENVTGFRHLGRPDTTGGTWVILGTKERGAGQEGLETDEVPVVTWLHRP